MPQDKILFEYPVDCRAESRTLIDGLSPVVFPLHIQSEPADPRISFGFQKDMIVQGSKGPSSAVVRINIDALDPPKDPVSPVAPFIRNHELADRLVALAFRKFSYDIESILGTF